jgi:AcrR family transcriptional regulator
VLAATLALLRAGGPSQVNMQAVSARSGVAKTSIYRRYPGREDLLRAAISSAVKPPAHAPVEGVRERLSWGLSEMRAVIDEVLGPGGVASLIDDREPEFTRLVRGLLEPYAAALAKLVADDIAAGLLRRDLDADALVSIMVGAYLGEVVRYGRVRDEWLSTSVALLYHAAVGQADQ